MRAVRFDLARLDAPQELPDGSLRVPARVAKVGVLTYTDGEGNSWGELVPPETLFDSASMASLRGAAVVDLHPSRVTLDNRRELQRGHVGDVVRRDGAYLAVDAVYVTDPDEIALVKSGQRRDVSCGYDCELDETPGIFDGVPYQRVQRSRVYNHLGLGPAGWGRAGTDVALKVDGASSDAPALVMRLDAGEALARVDAQEQVGAREKTAEDHTDGGGRSAPASPPAKGTTEKRMAQKTKRDGDEMPPKDPEKDGKKDADTAEEMVPKKDADAMAAQHTAKIAALEALLAEATKQIAELKACESAEIVEADVPEAVADSIVSKRLAKLDAAREGARIIAPAVKLEREDGGKAAPMLKVRDIQVAAIASVLPTMKLDGLSDEGVNGVFVGQVEAAKAAAAKRADGGRKAAAVLVPDANQADDVKRQEREDGAADFDPIAHQRAEMARWGQRNADANANANTNSNGSR